MLTFLGSGCALERRFSPEPTPIAPNAPAPTAQIPSIPSAPVPSDPRIGVKDPNVLGVGDILWQASKPAEDLKLFTALAPAEDGTTSDNSVYSANYFVTGKVKNGKYAGADFYTVFVQENAPVPPQIIHVVKTGSGVVWLESNSMIGFSGDYSYPGIIHSAFTVDSTTTIPELEVPETITDGDSHHLLTAYTRGGTFFADAYSAKDISVLFIAPDGHVVYKLNDGVQSKENSYNRDITRYLIKFPDDSYETYSVVPPFVDSDTHAVHITWKGGAENIADYTIGDGMETDKAILEATAAHPIDIATDLTPTGVGMLKDGTLSSVYEFKSVANPIFKATYKQYVDMVTPYHKDNPKDNPAPVSIAAFAKLHPVFFWEDYFGHLIKFHQAKYYPDMGFGKPVIYLYPQKREAVSVKVEERGGMRLTKTEPAYGTGWNVIADPSGTLTNRMDGKIYPFLFWEAKAGTYTSPVGGWTVAARDVHAFLQGKLTELGLSQKESSDFSAFWEPRMQGAPYFLVSFHTEAAMNHFAPLEITPRPDTVIRVLMDFKPLAKPITIQPQVFHTPTRKGFTVVEWGGILRDGSELK